MDATAFVSLFCDRVALQYAGLRQMYAFYLFQDKRPGTLEENFIADAKSFDEYRRLFQK